MASPSSIWTSRNSHPIWKMPDRPRIVTNTTPLIALAVATGSLEILRHLYREVVVPLEVSEEIMAGGKHDFGLAAFQAAAWLTRKTQPALVPPYIRNALDRGEGAVIQTAIDEKIDLVCIDEVVGRRFARLSGLNLTGTIGVLLKAQQQAYPVSIREALSRMQDQGIWLSERVIRFALDHARD